jgi:hypothetical protein
VDAPDIVAAQVARMIPQHRYRRNRMTLPNDEFVNRELTIEELEMIAAGGFWSTLRHVGSVVGKIGVGVAIGLSIFSGVSVAVGGSATSRNTNVN